MRPLPQAVSVFYTLTPGCQSHKTFLPSGEKLNADCSQENTLPRVLGDVLLLKRNKEALLKDLIIPA